MASFAYIQASRAIKPDQLSLGEKDGFWIFARSDGPAWKAHWNAVKQFGDW